MKKIIYALIAALLFIISCKNQITNPPEKQLYSSVLKGKVTLENQSEYSNCLVYIDSLNRGVSSDSSGNYTILFTDEDSIYSGEFKLIYFLNDYDKDSAEIYLVKGKVKLDTLDVNSEGEIKTKGIRQIVLVEGQTDKSEYKIGDTVTFTARVTNLASRTIHISITSCNGEISNFVALYNDKYYPFELGGYHDVLTLECDYYLQPGEYHQASITYEIIEYTPLIPDEYIVTTGFSIEERLLSSFQSKFSKYVLDNFYKFTRGPSPKLDFIPNKYQFPHVKIIN